MARHRRSTRHRVHHRRFSRRRGATRHSTLLGGLRKALFPVATGGSLVFAATEGSANFNAGRNYNLVWRLKDFISTLGIGGIDVSALGGYPSGTYVTQSAFSPKISGALNKYSIGGGLAYLVTKYVPFPGRSWVRPVAKGALVGGIIGGVLDPAVVPQPQNYQNAGAGRGSVVNPIQYGQS